MQTLCQLSYFHLLVFVFFVFAILFPVKTWFQCRRWFADWHREPQMLLAVLSPASRLTITMPPNVSWLTATITQLLCRAASNTIVIWGKEPAWWPTVKLSYSEVGTHLGHSVPWFSICGYFPINSFCFPSIYPDCSRRSQKTLFALSYACFVLYSYQSIHCEKWSVMDCNWESKMGGGATAPGLRLTLD